MAVVLHNRAFLRRAVTYMVRECGNTNVINPERMDRATAAYNEAFGNPPIQMYTPERLAAQFAGLDLVEPGVVSAPRWRPDPADAEVPEMDTFVGVGRKS